jgi:hypothetical protein
MSAVSNEKIKKIKDFFEANKFEILKYKIHARLLPFYDENMRNLVVRMRGFQGKYKGMRCFLMGNGPSLNKMDLTLFRNEFIWGSNKCYLLFDRIDWRPKFYVGVDTRVIPDIRDDIYALERGLTETQFFFPSFFRVNGVLRSASNVYWFNQLPQNPTILPFGVFSNDVSSHVVSSSTVTIAMMQLAVYFGFSPIYLIGCDTTYSVPKTVQAGKKEYELVSTQNDDPNHFSKNYFGVGSKWHDPHPERMIEHYQQSKEACDQLGVQVFNATVGGNLEVFPRVNYLDIVSS